MAENDNDVDPESSDNDELLKFNRPGETILNKMQLEIMDQATNPNFKQSSPVMRMGEGSLQSRPRVESRLWQIVQIFSTFTDLIWTFGT